MKNPVCALLTTLFIPCLASANLVTNGSFEMPRISSVSSDFFVLFPDGSTAIDGWTVIAGDDPDPLDRRMDLTGGVPNWLAASDGDQLIDLASTQGFNKGIQSIPINVISGQTYTLSFDIGNFYIYRSNVGVSFNSGEWSDGTTGEKQFLNTTGPIFDGTTNWKKITLTWVAKNTTSTQISFFGRDPGLPNTANENYDENPFLDNVVFTQVGTAVLPAPTLLSPVGTVSSTAPTFSWNAIPGATSYLLSVTDALNASVLTTSYTAARLGCAPPSSVCSVRPASFTNNMGYTANVQAVDANNNSGARSPVQSFSIASTTPPLTFNDNPPSNNPYYTYVNTVAAMDIAKGCGNGNFCTDGMVTRGEMAAFVIRALEGEPAACTPEDNNFADVPYTHDLCKYIKRMKARNITSLESGTYGINEPITREQMAAFIVRAIDGNNAGTTAPTCSVSNFGDVAVNHAFCGYMQRLAALNITQGCQAANPATGALAQYCPGDAVTRGQMAAFISKAFLGGR